MTSFLRTQGNDTGVYTGMLDDLSEDRIQLETESWGEFPQQRKTEANQKRFTKRNLEVGGFFEEIGYSDQ